MILLLKIAAIVIVLLVIAGAFLRFRKLRRDEMRELSKPTDRRLMTPPPSPYAPSKGFRLLDKDGVPVTRPEVERPRLDPDRHYVFGESMSLGDDVLPSQLRHKDDWFLTRSAHRSTLSIVLRVAAIILAIALVVAILVGYYTKHHNNGGSGSQRTTTTTAPTTTTTATTSPLPSTFTASSTSGDDATYSVPRAKYAVSVTGSKGATWVVFDMGPKNTLEYQGTVAKGATKTIVMTGNSRITVGSPSNASVTVVKKPVAFPTPLPSTLNLVFEASTHGATTN